MKTYTKIDDRTLEETEEQTITTARRYSLAEIEARIKELQTELSVWQNLLTEAQKVTLQY